MWNRAIIVAILVLFVSYAFAQTIPPKIIDFNISPKKYYYEEGELITMSAVTVLDITEKDDVNYSWSFGDGTSISGDFNTVYHVFYISESKLAEQKFTLSLTITTPSGSDSRSTTLNIRRGRAKVVMLHPKDITSFNTKDVPIKAFLSVLDSGGNPINLYLKDVNILMGSRPVEKGAISESGFEVTITPSNDFSAVEFLNFSAMRGTTQITAKIPLYFSPLELRFSENPLEERRFYIADNLGRINFCLAYPNGSKVANGNFYVELLKDGNLLKKQQALYDGKCFYTDFNYFFTLNDYEKKDGQISLSFYGEDFYGNKLNIPDQKINILKDNPSFDLTLKRPSQTAENSFGFFQNLTFEALLKNDTGIPNQSVDVFLTIPALDINQKLRSEGNLFVLSFDVPKREIRNAEAKLYALADLNGLVYADVETFRITVTGTLGISFIYPAENKKVTLSQENKLLVNLRYSDESLVNVDEIKAILSIDQKSQEIRLKKDYNKGYYYYVFPEKLAGKHTLKLELKEPFSGSSEIIAEIEEPLNLLLLGLVLTIITIFIVGFNLLLKRVRQNKENKSTLVKRLSEIESEMQATQSALFSRRISIDEYKSRMLVLQNEMDAIEKELSTANYSFFSKLKSKIPRSPKGQKMQEFAANQTTQQMEKPTFKAPVNDYYQKMPKKEPYTPVQQQLIVPEWPKPPVSSAEDLNIPEEIVPLVPEKRVESPKERISNQTQVAIGSQEIKPKSEAKIEKELTKPKEEIREFVKRAAVFAGGVAKASEDESKLYSKEEQELIRKLCNILEPASKSYKPGEVYRALVEEGYKPYVALAVVEKLFNIK
ncbi:MAG: hypothetical protein N3F05_02150 [Candidatus Diapherotrites archaeon]|nr:hypothetical protein [Candidatus Diapherotrites archaeon]